MPPNDIAIAQQLEAQGYFAKAAQGDARAASLFVRLFAYTANPNGNPSGWGWLKKGGGHQIDGYSEDATVYGSNPSDLHNVVDMVIGTGAPGARLVPNTTATVPRRESDTWQAPRALTAEEMNYLKAGSGSGTTPVPPTGPACPDPNAHKAKPYVGDPVFDQVGLILEADYKRAGRPGLDNQSGRWFGRVIWDCIAGDETGKKYTMQESIDAHRPEWCAALGIPV